MENNYKFDSYEDYKIRFCYEDYPFGYAKLRNGNEFATDFTKNNTGYEVYRMGKIVTKEEYDALYRYCAFYATLYLL